MIDTMYTRLLKQTFVRKYIQEEISQPVVPLHHPKGYSKQGEVMVEVPLHHPKGYSK